MLCAEVAEGHPGIKMRIASLPSTTIHQDGDDGFGAFLFDVSDFDAVAAVILPRKRRKCHLSPNQLANGAERLRLHRQKAQDTEQNIQVSAA